MRNRIFVSIAIVATLLLAYFSGLLVHKSIMDAFIMVIIFFAVNEMRRAFHDRLSKEFEPLLIGYSITVGIPYIFLGFTGVIYYTLLVFVIGGTIAVFKNLKNDVLQNFAFILIYPGLVLSALLFLNDSHLAPLGLALVFSVSMFCDMMAMLGGMAFGKRKLAPELSPKKTIEGAVFGLFGGFLGAALIFVLFEVNNLTNGSSDVLVGFFEHGLRPAYVYLSYVLIALFGAAFTQVGDLMASLIKRNMGIKDYSRMLGNHGGVMDRVDGIMMNGVFVSLIFTFIV